MAAVDGDFDIILADLKSACFFPTCSEDLEVKDPMVGENGGDAAPGSDEATGEEGALKWPYFMFRDWPCVALNPCRSAAFYDEIIKWLCGISEDVEYKHRGMVLGSRIFLISCLEMLETSALGLG
ncbi:hypothetical protein F2Q70_00021724 [Brassica cretica]|uniref:Uncharacterized protein n=1 Tax=Brassica cretica TaxID=69181 RepID=A0A8S9GKC3_BRACR|nr:hypothetical protein F2Q70_00021724 [Brassica cretica]